MQGIECTGQQDLGPRFGGALNPTGVNFTCKDATHWCENRHAPQILESPLGASMPSSIPSFRASRWGSHRVVNASVLKRIGVAIYLLFAGLCLELTSRPGASFEVRCRSNTVESRVNCDKCFLYKELHRMGRLDLKAWAGVISLTIAGGRD